MKRMIFFTMLCISLGSWSIAPVPVHAEETLKDHKYKNLQKLYEKGKIDKGIEISRKFQKLHPKEAEPWFYASLYYIEKAKQAKTTSYQQSYTRKSIKAYKSGLKRDQEAQFFRQNPSFSGTISEQIELVATNIHESTPEKALPYFSALAELFHDTTEVYRDHLQSIAITEPIPVNGMEENAIAYTKDSVAVNRNDLVAFAESLVGTPYKYGGESSSGLDCSGFNLFVYKEMGVKLPHNAHMQSKLGNKVNLADAKKGDLIFFGSRSDKGYRASHAGMIYKNDDTGLGIIHCVSRGVVIDTEAMKNYWMDRVLFVKRIIN